MPIDLQGTELDQEIACDVAFSDRQCHQEASHDTAFALERLERPQPEAALLVHPELLLEAVEHADGVG